MSLIERPRQCVVIICDDKKQSTWQANQTLQRMTLLLLRNKKNVHNFPPVEDLQSFIIIRTRPRRILRSKYFSPSQPSESASLQMFSRFFLEWLSVFQLHSLKLFLFYPMFSPKKPFSDSDLSDTHFAACSGLLVKTRWLHFNGKRARWAPNKMLK